MGVAEGGAMERNDEPPTGLLDSDNHASVREDDELVDIREECEEEDVENHNPSVNGASHDNPLVGKDPTLEFSQCPLTTSRELVVVPNAMPR